MKKGSAKKTLLIGMCAGLLVVVVGVVVIAYGAWNNPVNVFLKDALSSGTSTAVAAVTQNAGQSKPKATTAQEANTEQAQIVNILLLGIDSNQKREEENMGWRSDMVMLCTFNPQKDSVALTTIPRDTRTTVYHVDKEGNPTKKGLDKINAAYSYGGGPDKFGPENAMRAVSDLLTQAAGRDITVQYYISTDMDSIAKLTDSFGGVKVELDVDFPGLGKKGDTVLLTGSNVNKFLQNRYDVGGDLARARHHAQFLQSLMKKFKANGGVDSLTALLGYAAQYARTNLNFEQDVALVSLLSKCNVGSVDYRAIGGESKYIGGISYYLPDLQDVRSRINALTN